MKINILSPLPPGFFVPSETMACLEPPEACQPVIRKHYPAGHPAHLKDIRRNEAGVSEGLIWIHRLHEEGLTTHKTAQVQLQDLQRVLNTETRIYP